MVPCLIVVDYQQNFVLGPHGFPAARALEPRLAARIQAYRQAGGRVIFTLDQGGSCRPGRPLEGSLLELVQRERRKEDLLFFKKTFGSAGLYRHLEGSRYLWLELAGVVSHLCVLANAVLARTACPQTPIWVDRDCVASPDPALQQAAFEIMAQMHLRQGSPLKGVPPFPKNKLSREHFSRESQPTHQAGRREGGL